MLNTQENDFSLVLDLLTLNVYFPGKRAMYTELGKRLTELSEIGGKTHRKRNIVHF